MDGFIIEWIDQNLLRNVISSFLYNFRKRAEKNDEKDEKDIVFLFVLFDPRKSLFNIYVDLNTILPRCVERYPSLPPQIIF